MSAMDSNGVRRRDTTKGPPLRILSLDGGGVRGYSMLIIIQELMHRTFVEIEGKAPRRHEIPKPCDHFDLICGTGTGGLIAIMLGRLRLDLETCKEVYVRMTRKVFETDKTIAGIPYRHTLFKASKLEEAIKECVREHTIYENEGNDDPDAESSAMASRSSSRRGPQRHTSNASVTSFSARSPSSYMNRPVFSNRWGNPNAKLYDEREHRTKTAVTAYYKGSPKGAPPAFLRSYDSRKETAPEFECSIWQAGRATSAIGLAFKEIKIGQSVFIDEGNGGYNPSIYVLDEATVNEWPGRDVGVFVSIGTGKRPHSTSDKDQHLWYAGFLGEFAEAKKRLISKIEGCEQTHQFMLKEHLGKRGVNADHYYRLNVEIGVGEFGMNEWDRLAEVSTGTRRYLSKSDVQRMNLDCAAKMAKIHKARVRLGLDPGSDHLREPEGMGTMNMGRMSKTLPNIPEPNNVPEPDPLAVELPAGDVSLPLQVQHNEDPRSSYESGQDNLAVNGGTRYSSPRGSQDIVSPVSHSNAASNASSAHPSPRSADDKFVVHSPTPQQYRSASGSDKIAIMSLDEYPRPKQPIMPQPLRMEPPPLPPKTPIPGGEGYAGRRTSQAGPGRVMLPYPLDDGPPPVANMARKPDYPRH